MSSNEDSSDWVAPPRQWRRIAPWAVLGAVVSIIVTVAVVGQLLRRAAPSPVAASQSVRAAYLESLGSPTQCPAAFKPAFGAPPPVGGAQQLVQPGVLSATLCTYSLVTDAEEQPLQSAKSLPGSAVNLVDFLNGLPDRLPGPTDSPVACSMMGWPGLLILIQYPDRPSALIEIDRGCGAVVHGGTVRFAPKVQSLLAFWP